MVRPPTVSFLVAFRDVDGTRTRLWDLIRDKLEASFPDAEIVVGTDDGVEPFHKTLALNRAAAASSGSVLAIWDADTWIDDRLVNDAIEQVAADPHVWCRPYRDKLKMNAAATDAVLAQGVAWDGTPPLGFGKPEWRTTYRYAPPFVISRMLWDAVGGMCERFRGWGQEDEAFALAAERLFGQPRVPRAPATALHLFHERIGRSGNDRWGGQTPEHTLANRALLARYRQARTSKQMTALLEEL